MTAPPSGPWDREAHTAAKHDIYRHYLDAWFPILIQAFREVTVAEGFAGPGIYTGGEPGSPIIALEAYKRSPAVDRCRRARFIFVENHRACVDRLKVEVGNCLGLPPVEDYDDGKLRIAVRKGRCEEILTDLIQAEGAWDKPLLALLDSFGGAVPAAMLQEFARRKATEVVVTIKPNYFNRFASNPDFKDGDETFGSTDWRNVAKVPEGQQRLRFLEAEYRATMRAAGFSYVLNFVLVDATGYELHLFFGTNSDRGVAKMKDALWRVDPTYGRGYKDPADPMQELLPMALGPQLAPLSRAVVAKVEAMPSQTATINHLRQFANLETIFKESHVQTVVVSLVRKGELERVDQVKKWTKDSVVRRAGARPLF